MKKKKEFLLVAVNMGYGHQRTAYPLRRYAFRKSVINANDYKGIPEKDKKIWRSARSFYEFISNFKRTPLIGDFFFSLYDEFQKIPVFYPRRDLSQPTFSLKNIYKLIKKGWGRHLIEKLKKISKEKGGKMPLVTTFFTPAFMAEVFDYPGEIFCIVCDADVSRTWAPLEPRASRIKYFASNSWTKNRLLLYGVKKKNIFLTGYPLPEENIGGKQMKILKQDLKKRIINLDPQKRYRSLYAGLIKKKLGILPNASQKPFTLMFSIGGAGAQKEIVSFYLKAFKEKIDKKEMKIILSGGIKEEIKNYFLSSLKKLGLRKNLNKNIEIIFKKEINGYFQLFNKKAREADILWTKPSELSFYTALGVPILMAPCLGSQERYNQRWLLYLGSGIKEENPEYADEWLFDYLKSGRFAEAAMQGFIEGEKFGIYKIQEIINQT